MGFDVTGLGNALVDALVRVEDDGVLDALELTRGQMHPVDDQVWSSAYARVEALSPEIQSGGSCANTLAALGLMGVRAQYCGQVGDDDLGKLYIQRFSEACGSHALRVSPEHPTGKCLSLISSQDAERTMLTDLGAAVHLPEIGSFDQDIRSSKVLHLTAYLLLGEPMKSRAYEAIAVANQEQIAVSLDVADPFVIGVAGDAVRHVLQEFATIVFLNAEEAAALCGKPPQEALEELSEHAETVVLKLGREGSLVWHKGETFHQPICPVNALDTTGAGDAYAAGFLYGWVRGWEPWRSAALGSRVASLTVGQMGAVCRDKDALLGMRSEAEGLAGPEAR